MLLIAASVALGLFLIKSLAESRLGWQAPLQVVPHSDDSERGEVFLQLWSSFRHSEFREKMQLLTTCLQSLGRDTHLACWIVRRDSVPQQFCVSTKLTVMCFGQLMQPLASHRVSAGAACSVAVLRTQHLQKNNSSIVLAPQW